MYFTSSPSPPRDTYTTSVPMNVIPASSARPHSPSCAYPAWPRRSSLSSNSNGEDRASSFIPDDDLEGVFPCVFDEADCTIPATPRTRSPEVVSSMHEAQVVVDFGEYMKELIAQEKAKRERKPRRRSGSSRKSRSGTKPMSSIVEARE